MVLFIPLTVSKPSGSKRSEDTNRETGIFRAYQQQAKKATVAEKVGDTGVMEGRKLRL